jgi:FkbM family methyltransferase
MKEQLINIFKHINRFGFVKGIVVYSKNYFFTGSDSFISLPGLPAPIFLRKKSSDIPTFDQVFVNAEYDYKINIVPEIIIDCGANVGLSTLFFKRKFPSAQIIAIEPEESNYQSLVKNTLAYKEVTPVKAGVWPKTAMLEVVDEWNFGNWGFVCKETDVKTDTSVSAISIPDLMKKFNIEEIDLLKIDVEGTELELFSSDYEYWLPKTKVIMIELHDSYRRGCSKSFFSAIVKYDFSIYQRGENTVCIRN